MNAPSAIADNPDAWQQSLASIAGDLAALDSDGTYKDLERGIVGSAPAFSGDSLVAARRIVSEVQTIFRQYSLLYARLDRALKARSSVLGRIAGKGDFGLVEPLSLQAIETLEVQLPELVTGWRAGDSVAYPLTVQPSRLLSTIPAAIAHAQTGVDQFRAAESGLASITSKTSAILNGFERQAVSMGLGILDEIVGARARLVGMQASVLSDPLAGEGTYQRDVLPILEGISSEIRSAVANKQRVEQSLAAAQAMLQQLSTDHRRAIEGMAESPGKVVMDPSTLIEPTTSDAQLADMEQWLARIQALYAAGHWRTAERSLENWTATASPLAEGEARAAMANAGPIERLNFLRGRVSQLRAVALARNGMVALPGTEAGSAADLYQLAAQALTRSAKQPRIDLAAAAALVERYAALVDSPHESISETLKAST